MLNRDSLVFGIILGLLLPLIGTAIFFGIFEGMELMDWVSSQGFRPLFRERTSSIVGIALNAIALNNYSKKRCFNTVRGVVAVTTILIVVWLIAFGKHVL